MKIINRSFKASSQAQRDALSAYLAGKPQATGAEVRANVAALAASTDGELHQVAIDAGFVVEGVEAKGGAGARQTPAEAEAVAAADAAAKA